MVVQDWLTDYSLKNLVLYGQKLLIPSSDSAKLDAQLLLCLVLEQELSHLLTWPDKVIDVSLAKQYLELLMRRYNGEPIAYITGMKEFWSLSLAVSTVTLIPRPDTEILVEQVLEVLNGQETLSCLDLGTGTGAIALALASENPTWQVEGLDYSLEAVKLAQLNAKNLHLSQVHFYQSDWFSKVTKNKVFDVIVSNPPYIDSNDENLSQGDVRFEPVSALVAADNGLADIKHIANLAREYLSSQGKLFFEHGFDQGTSVRKIMTDAGYKQVQTVKDLSGHERVTWAIFNSQF
jgi:release factor glutamine methyltransferase